MADGPRTRAEHDLRIAIRRFCTRIAMLAAGSVVLDLVAAAIARWSENGAKHQFATFGDALFWTTTQLLTVSSQLPNPERTPTKILDVGLELYAVVVVSSLAATFADLLHHRTRHRSERMWQGSQ